MSMCLLPHLPHAGESDAIGRRLEEHRRLTPTLTLTLTLTLALALTLTLNLTLTLSRLEEHRRRFGAANVHCVVLEVLRVVSK